MLEQTRGDIWQTLQHMNVDFDDASTVSGLHPEILLSSQLLKSSPSTQSCTYKPQRMGRHAGTEHGKREEGMEGGREGSNVVPF